MALDYEDILNRSWDEVPEPQNLPSGGWLLKGTNVSLVKPREEGQSLKVLFTYKAVKPVSVAEDLLEEMGDYDFSVNDLQFTVYLESAADWNSVRKHLAIHDLSMDGNILDGNGKLAFAKKFRGAEVIAQVGERSYENSVGETVWQNTLSKFQKVAD